MTTIRNVFDIVPEEVRTAFDGNPHLTKPRPAKQSEAEPVTLDRLERGLVLMAYFVVLDGPVLAPLFEKLEREVEAMRANQDTVDRRVLVQGSMRSDAIVIVGVGFQDPTQMHLAQGNDVVQTLTPDRSDQPFGKARPGRPERNRAT
jgi:hypothetical protein